VQWSPGLDGFQFLGQGNVLGVPMPIIVFAITCLVVAFFLRRTRLGTFIYAWATIPSPPGPRASRRVRWSSLQYVIAAAIGLLAGLVLVALGQQRPDAHLQFDADLRRDPRRRAGRHWPRRRPRRRVERRHRHAADRHHAERHDDHGHVLSPAQNLVKGVVLLVAVIADSFLNPRNEETAQQGDI
jgi:ribose transport system permease protein